MQRRIRRDRKISMANFRKSLPFPVLERTIPRFEGFNLMTPSQSVEEGEAEVRYCGQVLGNYLFLPIQRKGNRLSKREGVGGRGNVLLKKRLTASWKTKDPSVLFLLFFSSLRACVSCTSGNICMAITCSLSLLYSL